MPLRCPVKIRTFPQFGLISVEAINSKFNPFYVPDPPPLLIAEANPNFIFAPIFLTFSLFIYFSVILFSTAHYFKFSIFTPFTLFIVKVNPLLSLILFFYRHFIFISFTFPTNVSIPTQIHFPLTQNFSSQKLSNSARQRLQQTTVVINSPFFLLPFSRQNRSR